MTTQEKKAVWKDWVSSCLESGRNLTEWETDFVQSLGDQLDRVGSLSPRQSEILEGIVAKRVK